MVCRWIICFVVCLSVLILPVFATDSEDDTGEDTSQDISVNVQVDTPEYTEDNPLPVYIVPDDDEGFQDFSGSGISPYSVTDSVDNEFPSTVLFTGCWFVTGTDSNLGTITIYIPADVDPSYFGFDANGYLVYTGSSSISCYLSGVRNNRVTFSSFGTGSYSVTSGNTYQTYDLQLTPSSSNLQIQDSLLDRFSFSELFPYVLILVGGVMFICFMRRS